jgi:hypothetical protein
MVHNPKDTFYFDTFKPGVGNLFITAGRIGYLYVCRGPQKKLITVRTIRTVGETISLTQKVQLVFR